MGRFDNIISGKGKEVQLGEEVFVIKPLNGEHIGLFLDLDSGDKKQAMLDLVLISLKETDDTITIADVKSLPLKTLTDLVSVIVDVNELS